MRFTITFIILAIALFSRAQTEVQDSIKKSVDMDEIVVSVNKTEEMKRLVAAQVMVINSKQIQFDNPLNSGDMLANTGQIMVQKSQQGGGSPVIRGFEASRILLVIDGVRMNNIIYRSGHLQNVITIDPSMLDKTEVFFGSSSTIYGSDALGGTIHFITKKPKLDATGKKTLSLNAMQRFSSVNNGLSTNINFNLGFKKFASLTSITYNKFGDLKMGKSKNIFFDSIYGLRTIYAQNVNGVDSAITNSNKYIQTQSGYSQVDLLQKFLYQQNKSTEHQLNFQFSNSSNIPRYDRLTDLKGNNLKYSEWYYGPQNRMLVAYNLNVKQKMGFDNIHFGVNYQTIQESRVTRNFKSSTLNSRIENVGVIGYNLDFQKSLMHVKFRFGFDGQANTLKSTAFSSNIISFADKPLDTRYPNGKNSLNHNAFYLTHTYDIPSKKLTFNEGFRIGISNLSSTITDNSFFNLPVTSVKQNNLTRSAYLGIIYNPIQPLKLSYMVSTGFRVPNIDDLSKIFETSKGNVIIPNPNLKPEKTLTNEIGITYKPTKSIRIETCFWYTNLTNALTTGAAQLNGKDSILYDGQMSKVYSNTNAQESVIYGYNASINANLTTNSQLYANISYTKGTVTSGVKNVPLDHISPITANLGYSQAIKKFTAEGIVMFNGKKDIKNYSSSGEDNQQYAPHGGIPAWMTLNLRLAYKLPNNFVAQGGIENILDTQYRVFASGINAPGRNIYLAIRFSY